MKILLASFRIVIACALFFSKVSAFTSPHINKVKSGKPTSLYAKEICVLGGGFGGLNAALTLSSLPWDDDDKPTITLVDKKERFVFLPLLYELCVGDADFDEVAPTYESLLQGTDIKFRQANIQGIDSDNDSVYIDNEIRADDGKSSSKIHYDSLIVATGADVCLEAIPGAESCALPFYTIDDCLELRKRLNLLDSLKDDIKTEINVVVIGGGYSGVELALNMKERLADVGDGAKVTIVHRGQDILECAEEFNRNTGKDRLEKAGVESLTGSTVTKVIDDRSDTEAKGISNMKGCKVVIEKDNEDFTLNADILLWTAGAMSTNSQRGILNSKIPRDSSGRIVTNQFLAAKGSDNVFVLGDCSRVKKVPYAGTAAVAMQQAPFAAWNAYASLMSSSVTSDEKLKQLPFSYLNLGEMMTLGGEDATISSMGLLEVNGAAASVLRRLIYAVRMPTVQQALTATISSSNKRFESLLSIAKPKTKTGKSKIIEWQ